MSTEVSYELHRLEVQGNAYEVGEQLGRFGAQAVHRHLLNTHAWATVQQWQGSAVAQAMAGLTRQHFPAIWQELEGLAAGLELPIEQVFLWNARGDLWAMAPDGCTSIMLPAVNDAGSVRICHNEDGDPGFAGQCAIVQCTIKDGAQFASFVYPGSLPGHTLAVNSHGLAMTVNNVRALTVDPGLPRMVLTRAILDLADVAQAAGLLQRLPRAGAFHLNLGDTGGHLISVEYSSDYCSVIPVSRAQLHANHAVHPSTRDWPQIITGSSGRRQLRGDALMQTMADDPLGILADQDNARYPIYRRRADDIDNENTLATADMMLGAHGVDWQVYEDPRQPARFRLHNASFVEV